MCDTPCAHVMLKSVCSLPNEPDWVLTSHLSSEEPWNCDVKHHLVIILIELLQTKAPQCEFDAGAIWEERMN